MISLNSSLGSWTDPTYAQTPPDRHTHPHTHRHHRTDTHTRTPTDTTGQTDTPTHPQTTDTTGETHTHTHTHTHTAKCRFSILISNVFTVEKYDGVVIWSRAFGETERK